MKKTLVITTFALTLTVSSHTLAGGSKQDPPAANHATWSQWVLNLFSH